MTFIELALSHIGISEVAGTQANPEIAKFFDGFPNLPRSDEIPWCSLFLYWCAKQANLPIPPKNKAPMARSWLHVGTPIDTPQVGDIAIFSRSSSPISGHVGIFCNQIKDNIFILGGNQKNSVCIKSFPKQNLIAYRRISSGFNERT